MKLFFAVINKLGQFLFELVIGNWRAPGINLWQTITTPRKCNLFIGRECDIMLVLGNMRHMDIHANMDLWAWGVVLSIDSSVKTSYETISLMNSRFSAALSHVKVKCLFILMSSLLKAKHIYYTIPSRRAGSLASDLSTDLIITRQAPYACILNIL